MKQNMKRKSDGARAGRPLNLDTMRIEYENWNTDITQAVPSSEFPKAVGYDNLGMTVMLLKLYTKYYPKEYEMRWSSVTETARKEKHVNIIKTGLNQSVNVIVQDDDGDIKDIEDRALRIYDKVKDWFHDKDVPWQGSV